MFLGQGGVNPRIILSLFHFPFFVFVSFSFKIFVVRLFTWNQSFEARPVFHFFVFSQALSLSQTHSFPKVIDEVESPFKFTDDVTTRTSRNGMTYESRNLLDGPLLDMDGIIHTLLWKRPKIWNQRSEEFFLFSYFFSHLQTCSL